MLSSPQRAVEGGRKVRVIGFGCCPDLKIERKLRASEARDQRLSLDLLQKFICLVRLAMLERDTSGDKAAERIARPPFCYRKHSVEDVLGSGRISVHCMKLCSFTDNLKPHDLARVIQRLL